MRIVLILECTKLAYKKSRRVAAKYLNQIGRRTFENDLSEKALAEMHKELKEIVSKNNSIICYKTTLNKKVILFKLGNQKRFNEEGFYMYKTKVIEPDFSFDFEHTYLLKVIEISALFHDIGKSNKGFQLTLDYGIKENMGVANRYRHELVSFYMLMHFIEKSITMLNSNIKDINEKTLLTSIIETLKTVKSTDYIIDISYVRNEFEFFTKEFNWDKFPIINSIFWLVLTHHKLARNDLGNESLFEFSEYIKNEYDPSKNEYLKKFEEFVSVANGASLNTLFTEFDDNAVSFLEDEKFNKILVDNFDYILKNYDYFSNIVDFDNKFINSKMPSFLTLIARPALVFSDYKASADKVYSGSRIKGVAYANTITINETASMADTLLTHLMKTCRNISSSLRLFVEPNKVTDFRNLKRAYINKIEEKPKNVPEKFLWQEKAKEKLMVYQNDNIPFFGILMAGTGCGKTRASLKFLTALNNKNLRITVGLGLRTLSCQSHREYTKEIFNGLDNVLNEIGLAVGTCLNNLEKLEEIEETDNEKNLSIGDLDEVKNYNGSTAESASSDDDIDSFIDDEIHLNNRVLQVIAKTNKDKVFIDKPVVIMTIDNIMKAFKQDNSSNLRYLTRILSSDFVLDEIDDYDTKDLISISCLIYMLGYFRKKVLISSATVTSEISKTLFDFYKSGVLANLNGDKTIGYGFINEQSVEIYKKDFKKVSSSIFSDDLARFTSNVYDHISVRDNRFSKHRIDIVNFGSNLNLNKEDINDKLYESIKKVHHFNEIYYNELNISTGFVKFNNVNESQNFSNYIGPRSEQDEQYHFVWLNYHSHFMNLERFYIEDFLDSYMRRKSSMEPKLHDYMGSELLFKSEHFKRHIEEAKSLGKKNLIFVLNTTNIIEVGRDHDYDWAIIEPSSIKSVVQALGRVKRHRDINVHRSLEHLPKDYANVLLFDRFIVDLSTINKTVDYVSKVMAFPGIQTDRDKMVPLFPLEVNFSMGGNISKIYGSLNKENKYSLESYKKIKNLNNSLFLNTNYFKDLFNQDFLDNPSNKYLVHDIYESFDLNNSYTVFRLLAMEKFKQEFYLNSDYDDNVMSARYYLNNFNKDIIAKMSKEFYSKNAFRKSASSRQIYLTSSVSSLMNDSTILYEDKGNTYKSKFLLASFINRKRIFEKTKEIELNKNHCKHYLFADINFKTMYEKIVQRYNLNDKSVNLKFTMLELSVKHVNDMKFDYYLGLGKVKKDNID